MPVVLYVHNPVDPQPMWFDGMYMRVGMAGRSRRRRRARGVCRADKASKNSRGHFMKHRQNENKTSPLLFRELAVLSV